MSLLDNSDQHNFTDLEDSGPFEEFLNSSSSGIKFLPEKYGEIDGLVMKSDFGDFTKWLHKKEPALKVLVDKSVKKLILRSNEFWLPLAYLATDVTLPIYLNLISNYLYDKMRGTLIGEKSRVHLRVAYKDNNSGVSKMFSFDGDGDTLKDVIDKFNLNSIVKK